MHTVNAASTLFNIDNLIISKISFLNEPKITPVN